MQLLAAASRPSNFFFANAGSVTDRAVDGRTVMMSAALGGSIEAMKLVLANGGNMTDRDNDGWTVMMYAAYGCSIEAMKFVLTNGGNVTDRDNNGYRRNDGNYSRRLR